MVDERLDQVLGRLEAARDELEQHVEEDVVGELLHADLVLLLEDASDRVGLGVGAARCDERLDDLPHLGADAGEVGERLGRALRAAAAREQEGEALVHQAVEPWVLLHRQADQAERDRGRKRRRDRARDLDDAVGLGAVDDVADDLADHLLAAAHRARVEERRDDGADEGVPRLILLADLARRRLPSLEDVERDAREAPVVQEDAVDVVVARENVRLVPFVPEHRGLVAEPPIERERVVGPVRPVE